MAIKFSPDDLARFLVKAKRATYAAGGVASPASVKPVFGGASQLEFREGAWMYRDMYFGTRCFAGQEVVYFQNLPVWSMVYAGGFIESFPPEDEKVYGLFLQTALREVLVDRPFRGPRKLERGELTYRDSGEGTLERFSGEESLLKFGKPLYRLHYAGGFLS